MFINPKTAIEEGWIVFPEWMTDEQKTKCIQPNAIDITADKISLIEPGDEPAMLSESHKQFHRLTPMTPDSYGYVDILHHRSYDIHSDFYVKIPEGVAAELIIRSTLNRAGLALNSGLWDSGFRGNLGMVVYNRAGHFKLQEHTRVCQIKFVRSEVSGIVYNGSYNANKGQHWTETQSISQEIYNGK